MGEFGVFLKPQARGISRLREHVRAAEESGFDYVSVKDHPHEPSLLDALSLIAVLAGETSRVRFFPDVANLALRPPAMLAKAVATVDLLSQGRVELGLGTGYQPEQILAMGGTPIPAAAAVSTLDSALDVIRAQWAASPGAHEIGVWLGAAGPRMLDLTGRRGDGWIAPLASTYESKLEAQQRIDAAARKAGREPGAVKRVIQLVGVVADHSQTRQAPVSGPGIQPIIATPDDWAAIACSYFQAWRFDVVNFVPARESAEQIELFGSKVIPAVRERI